MESASCLRGLSQIQAQVKKFKQKPRSGQMRVFESLEDHQRSLNIKLPTGYGKTYAAIGCYSILKSIGEVNRLLVIFPSDGQLEQFEQATPHRLSEYAIDGPKTVCDVRYFGAKAIAKHQKNECQVYAITVQSLIGSRGMDNIGDLISKGRWMVVVDEYHHYGINKPFGNAVQALNHEFLLCMSATPFRPSDDGAFGEPDISILYRDAVEEKAVKPLRGHAYHYKIDAIGSDGDVVTYTTEQLICEAGGDSQEKINKLLIDKKLRWSPKYISPLITNPIERMLSERLKTGKKLQAIIGAMCVSHAELVCEQVSATFPDLVVDWVGTGDDGKSNEENKRILSSFATRNGDSPSIDVLVHVGMAGEGLDTVLVSEVIHLNSAGVNNTNNQENGRSARFLDGVVGHINFDATSGFAVGKYVGDSIMDAMDCLPPSEEEEFGEVPTTEQSDWVDLPEWPTIEIVDVECVSIDSGDETVKKMAEWFVANVKDFDKSDLQDKESDIWQHAIEGVRKMRSEEAALMDDKSTTKQWNDSVTHALSIVTGNVIKLMKAKGTRVEKSLSGDLKKRINGRKKREVGPIGKDVETCKRHYAWLKNFEQLLKESNEVPAWLM